MPALASKRWKFAAGLPLTIVCLALGNLLGVVVTALWGWENVQKGQPGSVAMGFVQGFLGALIAIGACDHFLNSENIGDFWVKWIVRLFAVLTVLLTAVLLFLGKAEIVLSWESAAALSGLVATEIGRRSYDQI